MSKVKYLFVVTANLISLQKLHVIPKKNSSYIQQLYSCIV